MSIYYKTLLLSEVNMIKETLKKYIIDNNFYVPLLDLKSKELLYYNFKDISPDEVDPYLRASIAMPFYNKGILFNMT